MIVATVRGLLDFFSNLRVSGLAQLSSAPVYQV